MSVEFKKKFIDQEDGWMAKSECGFAYDYETGTSSSVHVKTSTPVYMGCQGFFSLANKWAFLDGVNKYDTTTEGTLNLHNKDYNFHLSHMKTMENQKCTQ